MPAATPRIAPLARRAARFFALTALFMAMAGVGTYLALTLIIKGEDTVIVPDLTGKEVLYGLEVLSDLGLNTRVKGSVYHPQIPKNHVIDQDPEAGAAIKRGRDVKIRVSRGPETVVMPNLGGLTLQQARLTLSQNGLCAGHLSRMRSPSFSSGQIISQVPSPGAAVSRQACVDLLVSKGAAAAGFAMPDLSGLTLERALQTLGRQDLTLVDVGSERMNGIPAETVLDQQPPPGHRVTPGSRIRLTVNRRSDRAGHQKDRDQSGLVRLAIDNGFLRKRVQVDLQSADLTIRLFDDFVSPAQEIWLFVPKHGNPTLRIYVDGQLAPFWTAPWGGSGSDWKDEEKEP